MLYFLIELDEDRIIEDDKIYLNAAYKCSEETFAQRDVYLYKKYR